MSELDPVCSYALGIRFSTFLNRLWTVTTSEIRGKSQPYPFMLSKVLTGKP